jgi:hypothetical protein
MPAVVTFMHPRSARRGLSHAHRRGHGENVLSLQHARHSLTRFMMLTFDDIDCFLTLGRSSSRLRSVSNTSDWSAARQLPSFWTLTELRHTLQQTVSSRSTDRWHVMLGWRRKPYLIALGSSTGRAAPSSRAMSRVSVQPNLLCHDDAEFESMQHASNRDARGELCSKELA